MTGNDYGHLIYLVLLGCVLAIAFGASQVYATANPAATARNYCPDVAPCMSVWCSSSTT